MAPHGQPSFVLYVQSFGDLVTFNPHIHALVADGVFLPTDTFRVLPPLPEAALREALRHKVLYFLCSEGVLDTGLTERMLQWRHSGFSVHNRIRSKAADAKGRQPLVWTITAFTVAHSLTLAMATLGLVRVSQLPVEAIIALSIVFVASEIVYVSQGRPGLTERRPWIVALVFGLLYGIGFAGALREIGLPEQSIPLAPLLFNVGVELGQLVFIGVAMLAYAILKRYVLGHGQWEQQVAGYLIGTVAAYWTIERTVGFWS